MHEKELPKYESAGSVLSFFNKRPDMGGLVVKKTEDNIEFDIHFSDEFLGRNPDEMYSTLIVSIAAIKSMTDDLTKKIIILSGMTEIQVKNNIADVYYEIQKNKDSVKN